MTHVRRYTSYLWEVLTQQRLEHFSPDTTTNTVTLQHLRYSRYMMQYPRPFAVSVAPAGHGIRSIHNAAVFARPPDQ